MLDRIDVTIDNHEVPTGHSSWSHYEDDNIIVNIGMGNTVATNSKPVVIIEYCKLHLRVTGGRTLMELVKSLGYENIYLSTLNYVLASLLKEQKLTDIVVKIAELIQKASFRMGIISKQDEIKQVLGIGFDDM
jgi:hypothetical protein